MIIHTSKLTYGSQTVPPVIMAVQGDTGRVEVFEIADYTIPAGATATYFIQKPSGAAIYNSATISGNTITCELTAQSLAEDGENYMQVRIIVDEDIVTSFDVILLVRPFRGIDAVESTSEMNIFDQAVEKAAEDFQAAAEEKAAEVIETIPADYTELSETVAELNERLQTLVPTSSDEVNRIIKQLYIPSSVSLNLSDVYRITIYNGAVNLYGFRFFDRNNTRLLDFTRSSSFSGLTKIGDVIAEIGDLSDINDTSKNLYCSVYDSVLYQKQLVDAYNLSASNVKYTIAPEFSPSTLYYAGYYVWHDNELRMFTKDHPAGAWNGTDTGSAMGFLTDLAHVVFMFAVPYDDTKTYAVGDFCTLQNRYLYQCITPITTAETFTAGHWKRVFFTDVYNDEMKLLHSTIVTSNIDLNKIVKRFYVPASKNIDVSTITRAVVFNGYLNMYGVRFYNGTTMLINFTAGHYFEGYESINDFYGELGDYSDINSSQTFTCRLYESVYNEDGIIADYEASRSIDDNTSFGTYTPSAQTGQGNNTGTELTIASYNVAHYNDDVASVIIPNEKIKNFIDAIETINADILCVQEDKTYIDSNNVRTAKGYLYNPQYPNDTGTLETTIKSKIQPDESGTLTYSNGRWLGYGVYTFGSCKLLAVSTHPISSVDGETTPEAIAARLTQYTEMFQWINGYIDLAEIDISTNTTGESVHVPEHTHVVIGMDANSLAEDDRTNLTTLANTYDFVLGNGGRKGWLCTARSRFEWYSIDNIIVSDNVIINSFDALTSKYSALYSDHVPVVARVTLT